MCSLTILVLNELRVDLEAMLSGYRVIRQNFSSEYSKVSFDLIVIPVNCRDDLKMVAHFRKIPDYNPIPIVCFIDSCVLHLKNEALKFGANDYFILPVDDEELKYKVDSILRKSKWACKNLLQSIMPQFTDSSPDLKLTAREKDLLKHVSDGLSNAEISNKLCLSEMTVKTHLKNIFKKLNVSNRTEAVIVGLTYDLIEAQEMSEN